MTNPTKTGDAPKKYGVQLLFKDGRSTVINVPHPHKFIVQLASQLKGANASGTYWLDPDGPLLLNVNEVILAVSVAQE